MQLAVRARNMVGLSKALGSRFFGDVKRGGQEGTVRPAKALAALPWERARFRRNPWCSHSGMCKGLCGAKAQTLHRCF